MGAGHDHGTRDLLTSGAGHRRRLWWAAGLLTVFMVVEAVAAGITGSLALLSDAGHMFTDVLAIAMTLAAITAAHRAGTDSRRTYGLYRLEVLAALANAALLTVVAGFVLVQAVQRFTDPPHVPAGWMLLVAVGGLLANLVAFALLRSGAKENIGVRGAYLEVLGDLLGSAGVIVAALIIWRTGWAYADPIVAVLVALMILPRTFALGRSAIRILVQAAPEHLDVARVRERLAAVPGVCDVHDLHVWTLTEGMDVASAHLRLDPQAELGTVLTAAREALHEDFRIDHATLQVEPAGAARDCTPVSW
ncbi:cation efflux system protein [Actinoplanes lobatus]|uniref:Cation efflux system protein n=1 Tax=Actinoplanes lobatus TaxID=113568 RepID=A0A7W7HEU6_9ACTN|nr:cation diffusion facilitator family transporter [Actinoplanes lobatus]MBB4749229.1 cobalt-zinc-cadmium efflux system protein [Actinoplanes lobatus]GGN80235.1 cation efflux system protein [Actinoplanes lobatus]GIE45211.1 cation efflux system protein [Actinoplanes lobatus]